MNRLWNNVAALVPGANGEEPAVIAQASDPTDPPIPDQPVIPDAPSPGTPDDVPDIGTPEPEPDRQPGKTGD